ncbi:MAG: hypothetical protein LUC92_08000 [Clostridiales bacterium]|nr:hypothetical protein [Clostridiales bacterium]
MNNIIVYIGMDVHKESFTICSYTFEADKIQYLQKIQPDYKLVLKYIERLRKIYPEDTEYVCGYEAGCLGYALYNQLTAHLSFSVQAGH